MKRDIYVVMVIDTETESEAFDVVNEICRPHLPEHTAGTALADYFIEDADMRRIFRPA